MVRSYAEAVAFLSIQLHVSYVRAMSFRVDLLRTRLAVRNKALYINLYIKTGPKKAGAHAHDKASSKL